MVENFLVFTHIFLKMPSQVRSCRLEKHDCATICGGSVEKITIIGGNY